MTHRSRLAGIIIDCQADEPHSGAAFWSAALGAEATPSEDGTYIRLTRQGGMNTEVQAVRHPSRVHLDIETDDVEAEIARLKALGATEVVRIRTWVVMEAPTGHRFCVITAQTPDFEAQATTWD